VPNDGLQSTLPQQALVATWASLTAAAYWQCAAGMIANPSLILGTCLTGFATIFLADFLSGVYHWLADNFGDANTPIFGRQIAAFQGHHRQPWIITEREFCNNIHGIALPAIPLLVLALAAGSGPQYFAFISILSTGIVLSQHLHRWSHMKAQALPGVVVWMQDRNLILSRKGHGAHHKQPFDCNYCIVTGWMNPVLDRLQFFPGVERVLNERTGVVPRCWLPDGGIDMIQVERPAE